MQVRNVMAVVKMIATKDQADILNAPMPDLSTKSYEKWNASLKETALQLEKALKSVIEIEEQNLVLQRCGQRTPTYLRFKGEW